MFTITSIGDIHGKTAFYDKVMTYVQNSDLTIITGDLTRFEGTEKAKQILAPLLDASKKLFAVIGNLDNPDILDYIESLDISIHGKGKTIGDIGFFGLSGGRKTPVNTPTEFSEEQMTDILKKGYDEIAQSKIKIMISHTPPRHTLTDMAGPDKKHVGSPMVRKFIEEYSPDLCLCGHIHESKGEDKIGKTLIVNPGDFQSGLFCQAFIDNGDIKVKLIDLN